MENTTPINTLVYDEFCHACETIAQRANQPDLLETVLKDIRDHRSMVYMNNDGFLVLKPIVRNEELVMLVQLAYCVSGCGYKVYQSMIERIARQADCVAIEFYTVRLGFHRLATRLGYTKIPYDGDRMLWRKEL